MNRRRFVQYMAVAGGAAFDSIRAAHSATPPELAALDEFLDAFVKDQQIPGAALAVTYQSRLVHARGFGYADAKRQQPVRATDLFRIASISKAITATAIMQLIERRLLTIDATVWEVLQLAEPRDARWKSVTLVQLLHHTGGWDHEKFDIMFNDQHIAKSLKILLPIGTQHIIQYMLTQRLHFDPGSQYGYSNFGYCLLGRVIERIAQMPYERYVQQYVFAPLGIRRMRLGRTLASEKAATEVTYFDDEQRTAEAVVGNIGQQVELPYGAWSHENMDANGGWLGSAIDLARFAAAFDNPKACPILNEHSIQAMFEDPGGAAGEVVDGSYVGLGWFVWPSDSHAHRAVTSSNGLRAGIATYLMRRRDGVNWAVLFNKRSGPDGKPLSFKFRDASAEAFNAVKRWPDGDLFAGLL